MEKKNRGGGEDIGAIVKVRTTLGALTQREINDSDGKLSDRIEVRRSKRRRARPK